MSKFQIDIALDSITEDLEIIDGDFAMEESTGQHQRQLLLNSPGDFKQNPDTCVGVNTYIDDEGKGALARAITQQFMQDGMEVKDLSPNRDALADSKVKIIENAFYK